MVIHIIVVTYNRKELLSRILASLLNQSYCHVRIIVVDNGSNDGSMAYIEEKKLIDKVEWLRLPENIGGAGGFHEGMKYAIQKKQAEWLWLMDDDGYPENTCLEKLYNAALSKNLEAISPLQIDINQQDQLAFPVWLKKKQIRGSVNQIIHQEFLYKEANLFNGLLLHRSVVEKIGLPRKEFFIRGDEVDYTKSFIKHNVNFGTLISARFYHPSDENERVPMLGGLITTRDAHSDFKNYYMFRNRAVTFIEDGNALLLPLDFIRYSYYYLIHKRLNWKGLKLWCAATYDGIKGKLGKHPKY